jgi:hypothetical protein
VIVDGDPSGIEVVRRLREKYKEWPNEAFRTWSTTDFEHYYPEPFQGEVQRVLGLPRGDGQTLNGWGLLCARLRGGRIRPMSAASMSQGAATSTHWTRRFAASHADLAWLSSGVSAARSVQPRSR